MTRFANGVPGITSLPASFEADWLSVFPDSILLSVVSKLSSPNGGGLPIRLDVRELVGVVERL